MTLITKQQLHELRENQHRAHHDDKLLKAGQWHELFTNVLSTTKVDNTLTLRFGAYSCTVDADGNPVKADDEDGASQKRVKRKDSREGWNQVLLTEVKELLGQKGVQFEGSIPVSSNFDEHQYPAGMVVVTGKGNTGKTPMMHGLAAELAPDGYYCIRFGEPLAGYKSDMASFIDELAFALVNYKVIVIDSLKDVISAATGAASAGGMSRAAFKFMSDLGTMASSRGCTVLTSLNPSSASDRINDEVVEAIVSNATAVVLSTGQNAEGFYTWNFLTRTGEGQQRISWDLTMSYGEFSVVRVHTGGSHQRDRKAPESTSSPSVSFENDELNAIIHNMYRN